MKIFIHGNYCYGNLADDMILETLIQIEKLKQMKSAIGVGGLYSKIEEVLKDI